ncbi:transcription factor DIVARICATA-like [Tasmannia lanceolata]|uniref:transcription factor DIVARICATA-like n=1 Tax=Tasmannia lanceolata TaxID=3420 RepID=UPI004064C091
MRKWGMGIISPTSYLQNSNWFVEDNKNANWSHEENKLFEYALAVHDTDTPDRWHKIALKIPGKTVMDVIKHYKNLEEDVSDIEAGLIPVPGYRTSSFTLEWVNKPPYAIGGKRSSARPDQERKKGVPWTEDEHRRFLLGLNKYGKGDWKNISQKFVFSRTPTQVASHAQKYFIRQGSGGKDKRRSSIHDITTVNLVDNRATSPTQSSTLSVRTNLSGAPETQDHLSVFFDSNQPNEGATVFSPTASQTHGNLFMPPPYGMTPYGMKLHAQNFHRGTLHESQVGPHNMVFQFQSAHRHPHG